MSHVFSRFCHSTPPMAVSGDGPYLIDAQGKRYLDGCGGAAVSCLGYSNQVVTAAAQEQLQRLAWAHTSFFTSAPAEALADYLIERAPAGIDRVYFVSGGSEAMEAAIKLARQYFLERSEPERHLIVARRQSYHGNTLGALAIGGNAWRRAPFGPLLTDSVRHIDPCHYWRFGAPQESAFDYGQRMANQLETIIQREGPGQVAAFVAEPVVGATMGAVAAEAGYFQRIRQICNEHGVLLILDEVMCGMGRTGTLFASEQEGIVPDIVCIAKGLGAGYQAIGAMLCSAHIYEAIASGSGFFQHGHTYLAHPVACATGLAVLQEIENRQMLPRVSELGASLLGALQQRLGDHPNVGDIRGRGLFLGVELVADRESNAPLPAARKTHARVKQAAMNAGLMVYPMGGTIDGENGDHILIAPSFIIDNSHIDELVSKLAKALTVALA